MKLVSLVTAAALALSPMSALGQSKEPADRENEQRAAAPEEVVPLGLLPEHLLVPAAGAVILCVIFCFNDDGNPTPSTTNQLTNVN